MLRKKEKMNPVLKKSIVGLIIAVLFIGFISFIYFSGTVGKITGIALFSLIAIFAIFEFSKPFQIPLWVKILIQFSTIFIMLTPFNQDFLLFINTENSLLPKDILISLITSQLQFSIVGIPGIGFPIIFFLILIPCLFIEDKSKILPNFLILFIGIILITFSIKFLLYFIVAQFSLTLTLIASVALTDTFAYFGGKLFGNKIFKEKKLAPNISPNKTIEGALVGYFVSLAFLFIIFGLNYGKIGYVNFDKLSLIDPLLLLILVPFLIPLIAILGDLLFSFTKRILAIKDFSNLLPSHGGILDRFDSLILVLFVFSFFISFASFI